MLPFAFTTVTKNKNFILTGGVRPSYLLNTIDIQNYWFYPGLKYTNWKLKNVLPNRNALNHKWRIFQKTFFLFLFVSNNVTEITEMYSRLLHCSRPTTLSIARIVVFFNVLKNVYVMLKIAVDIVRPSLNFGAGKWISYFCILFTFYNYKKTLCLMYTQLTDSNYLG